MQADKYRLAALVEQAAPLGVDLTEVADLLRRAKELEADAVKVRSERFQDARGLIDELVSGDKTSEQALSDLGRASSEEDFRAAQARRVGLLEQAAKRAVHRAVSKAAVAAESLMFKLQEAVREAITASDEDLYTRAVGLFELITGWLVPSAAGSDGFERQFRRPDLLWEWRINQADEVREVGRGVPRHQPDGGVAVKVMLAPVGAPGPTFTDIVDRPEWGPGLYPAQSVVSNANTFAPRTAR
jgi:hypothetical protein